METGWIFLVSVFVLMLLAFIFVSCVYSESSKASGKKSENGWSSFQDHSNHQKKSGLIGGGKSGSSGGKKSGSSGGFSCSSSSYCSSSSCSSSSSSGSSCGGSS